MQKTTKTSVETDTRIAEQYVAIKLRLIGHYNKLAELKGQQCRRQPKLQLKQIPESLSSMLQ